MSESTYSTKLQQTIEALHTKPGFITLELRQQVTDYAVQLTQASTTSPDIPAEWEPYLKKVTLYAYKTMDEDVDQLKEVGHSEDEIFELTLCAALGAGLARLERGMVALKGDTPCD